MSRFRVAISLIALCFSSGRAEPDAGFLDSKFDAYVQQLCDVLHVPGISVAVVRRDSFESKGYGYARLPDVEATPDTLWYSGSTTKAFTAAAAALIVHDEVGFPGISWSSPLHKLLPWYFALEDDYYTSHITLEDALSHRSGLPRHDLAYGWDNADPIDVILTMRDLPLTAEPRTKWQYCNIMYAAVGQAIGMRGNLRFGDALKKLIWEPIGMISTTTSPKEAKAAKDRSGRSRLSRGYFWNEDHFIPEPYANIEGLPGAGATISSVNDYALWIQALLNAGSNDSSPISDAIYRDITMPRTIMNDIPGAGASPPLYALGWFVTMLGSRRLVTHSGSVTGFGANVYLLPDEGFGIVTMANTMGSSNMAGALIFLEVLKKLGKVSSAHDATHLNSLHQSVTSHPGVHLEKFRSTKGEHVSTNPKLPLPGHLREYVGSYRHPAYGVFNVSLFEDETAHHGGRGSNLQETITATSAPIKLHVRPSERTWPYELSFKHESDTLFAAELLWVHGGGDFKDGCGQKKAIQPSGSGSICRKEVFPEPLAEIHAVFERDINGEVMTLGMELEPEMLSRDASKWRDGMIWFEKLA